LISYSMVAKPNCDCSVDADTGGQARMSIGSKRAISSNRSLAGLDLQDLSAQKNKLTRALEIIRYTIDGFDMRISAGVWVPTYYPPANRCNIRVTESGTSTGHESVWAALIIN